MGNWEDIRSERCIWTGPKGELLQGREVQDNGDNIHQLAFFDFDSELRYVYRLEASAYVSAPSLEFSRPDLDWEEPSLKDFKVNMEYLKQCFSAGLANKAVPICFASSNKKLDEKEFNFLEKSWVENLENTYPIFLKAHNFSYIGLSPEILFERNARDLKTMALAGTRQLDDQYCSKEFLSNPKDREEHEIVVKSILEDLGSLGEISVSETYVKELKNLAHLRTDINLRLNKDYSNRDLVKKLHPTPALGVYPKGSLNDWFSMHNKIQDRSLFGAPVLIESGDWARCIVGIRCAFNENGLWKLGSGCGVVPASQWESEWQELHNKRKSVLGKLGLL